MIEEQGFNSVIRKVGGWGFILLVVCIFFYGAFYTVKWEKDAYITQKLDAYNNTVNVTAYHYELNDYVPIKNIGENKINSHWSLWNILIVCVALFIYQILTGGQKVPSLLPASYMKNLLKKEFEQRKGWDVDEYTVFETTYLQSRRFDQGESKPVKRIVYAEVKYNQKAGEQFGWKITSVIFDPYTAYEIDRIFMKELPEGFKPKCEICGQYPDEKVITPEGLEQLKRFGLMPKR